MICFRPSLNPCAVLLLACLVHSGLHAGEQRFSTRCWTVERGLPDNYVNKVLQDKRGYLWVGTAAGLARFDSINFKEYRDPENSPDFGYNIRDMALGPDGSVLTLPASGGVIVWKNEQPSLHPITEALAGLTPLDLFVEPGGAVWVGGTDPTMLVRWEKGKVSRFGQQEGINRRVMRTSFAVDSHGRTWVAMGEFLGWYQDGKLVPINQPMSEIGTAVLVAPARTGGLWVSSAERLLKLDNDRAVPVCEGPLWPAKRAGIQCLLEDSSGRLWVGTRREGVYLYAGGELRKVAFAGRLIQSIIEDDAGNIWVGSAGEGLCRLRPMNFTLLNAETGLLADASSSVCEDSAGAIWCANRAGGLARYKDGQVRHFGAVSDGWIFASRVAPDTQGAIWMGSNANAGLYRLADLQSGRLELVQPVLRGVHFLHGSRDGRMWVASAQGLGYFQDGGYQSVSTGPDRFEALAESHKGEIWVAASENQNAKLRTRLFEFTDGKLIERVGAEHWTSGNIHSLLFDHNDSLWIASAGGLVLKQGDKLTHFTGDQGLPDDLITQIQEDDVGFLWMTGRRALFRIKIEDLQAVADRKSTRVLASIFGEDDGLLDAAAPGGGQPRSWKGADGRLWFTLYRGVVGVDPAAITAPRKSPPLYIEEVLLDQQPCVSTEPSLEIPSKVQQVKIRFAVLDFSHPEHVMLRYKLEGFEPGWNEADEDRTARYSHLPPGEYRLVVQASDQNGVWPQLGISLLVHVESAWWQTRGFLIASILLAAAVIAWAVRIWSVKKLRTRLHRLEKEHSLERERARIARNLHDELGGSLTQIGLLADRLRRHRNMEEIERTLGLLVRRTQGLATDLESIVWTVSPQNNSWDRLASFIGRYARQFLDGSGLECRIEGAENIPFGALSVEVQHEVLAVCKEALNNVLKHSKAVTITVRLTLVNDVFEVRIQDDGVGFEPSLQEHSERNGLHNMRARAAELGGQITIESHAGAGTIVTLTVPAPGTNPQAPAKII